MVDVAALLKIALDETLHGRLCRRAAGAVVQLQIDAGKMMIGIGVELALVLGERMMLRTDGPRPVAIEGSKIYSVFCSNEEND